MYFSRNQQLFIINYVLLYMFIQLYYYNVSKNFIYKIIINFL